VELFGILFSIPAAFFASAIYSRFLQHASPYWPRLSRFLFRSSVVVLISLGAEVILLAVLGAVHCRELLGPIFYQAHFALFLLGVPSLATLLAIGGCGCWQGRWYVVAPLCAIFAFGLALLQYSVAESLYGIDGPFSGDGNG